MKILLRTLLFHFTCIVIFFIIYLNLSEYFTHSEKYNNSSQVDFFLLSTTIQAGVGYENLFPNNNISKLFVILQQLIMISTHVITLYIFTL